MASYKMSLAYDKAKEIAENIIENELTEEEIKIFVYDELVNYEDFLEKGMKEFE